METVDELIKAHPMSTKGVFNKYVCVKIIKSKGTISSIIVSILLTMILYFHYNDINNLYNFIKEIVKILLGLLPNLLGFCIGGYALIIGACNMSIIKRISEPLKEKNNLSYYQVLSSVFACTLIIQCFTLLWVYIINIVMLFNIETTSNIIGYATNMIAICSILLLSFMSLSLLFYTILNIFNLGQSVHFCVRLDNNKKNNNKHGNN